MGLIDKPGDLVTMMVIGALVITAFGLIYASATTVRNGYGANASSTSVFANMSEYVTSENYLQGSSSDYAGAMSMQGQPVSDQGIFAALGTALFKVGKVWSATEHAMTNFSDELGIPGILVAILAGGLLISFGLAIYLLFRGGGNA